MKITQPPLAESVFYEIGFQQHINQIKIVTSYKLPCLL